jgi:hypothetical protein
MGVLIGGFFILFGLVWTGILMAVAHSTSAMAPASTVKMLHGMTGLGVFFLVLGVILVIIGLIKARGRSKLAKDIMQRGTAAKGTVTFVDKNYGVLVNNKPIFSIVEFTFQDSSGKTHTSRKGNVNSDLIIRDKIEVGSQVVLKYLPDNPESNILILKDPTSNEMSGSV